MNGLQVRILRNLKERVHPVNVNVALHGVHTSDGYNALEQLIANGLVVKSELRPTHAPPLPMYQLSWEGRETISDNLTLVK